MCNFDPEIKVREQSRLLKFAFSKFRKNPELFQKNLKKQILAEDLYFASLDDFRDFFSFLKEKNISLFQPVKITPPFLKQEEHKGILSTSFSTNYIGSLSGMVRKDYVLRTF